MPDSSSKEALGATEREAAVRDVTWREAAPDPFDVVMSGGRSFVGIVLVYAALLALALGLLPWDPRFVVPGTLACFVVHMSAATFRAEQLLVTGRADSCLRLVRWHKGGAWARFSASSWRHLEHLEIQALFALERQAQALRLAWAWLAAPGVRPQGWGERMVRLALAHSAFDAGANDLGLAALADPPPERWGTLRRQRDFVFASGLIQSERAREALELLTAGRFASARGAVRAAWLNNVACAGIDAGADPREVLAWARAAHEARVRPPWSATTLGAALLYADGDSDEAVRLLESVDVDDLPPGLFRSTRAFALFYRGLAYERLGRRDDAERAWSLAAADRRHPQWTGRALEALERMRVADQT